MPFTPPRCPRCIHGTLMAETATDATGRRILEFVCLQCGFRPTQSVPLPYVRERSPNGSHRRSRPQR